VGRVHAETLEQSFHFADQWRYERFLATIEMLSGGPPESVERAAAATLSTLGERLGVDLARELSAELPSTLREWLLSSVGKPERFDRAEFLRRVAEREGTDEATAERHAKAVLAALGRLVRGDELRRVEQRLPDEYSKLLHEARKTRFERETPEVLARERFLDRVAEHAALEPQQARHTTEAVLETLAERLAGGEVQDLIEALPEDLRGALERGRDRSGGKAQRLSLDEFIGRVEEREGVGWQEALEHIRAVFAALRETLTEARLSDILEELPRAYADALL
jgi:uncharacterized protein (DUF2267 family)